MQHLLGRLAALIVAASLAFIPSTLSATSTSVAGSPLAAKHEHKGHHKGHHKLRKAKMKKARNQRRKAKARRQQILAETPELDAAIASVFDLSGLRPAEMAWAQETLAGDCNFDWAALGTQMGDRRVTVELADPPARGMYYPAEMRLEVHKYFYETEPRVASRVLAWEAAHVVDLMSLTGEQRQKIHAAYHDGSPDPHGWFAGTYKDQVGEAFMEGFVAAFCPALVDDSAFNHETTPEIASEIRSILL